jgi:hypothetical protein
MRIHRTIFLLMLIPLATVGQTSNSFVGTWKVDVTESINRMDTKAKARFDSLTENHRALITNTFKSLEIGFNADNSLVINSLKDNQISTRNGTWTTEMATSSLIINRDGKVERFTYRFITAITLVIGAPDKLWFNGIYLTKN